MVMRVRALLIIAITVVAAIVGVLSYLNSCKPELGVDHGRLKPLKSTPNGVSTQASDPTKKVEPLEFKDTPAETMKALKAATLACGGAQIQEETELYLYVVFTTPKMGFHDDAEFWLDSEHRQVQFRSQARIGYSDGGVNRERYQKLRQLYEGSPAVQASTGSPADVQAR